MLCDSISFHGRQPWQPDWSQESRQLAALLCGALERGEDLPGELIYIIMNAHWETATFDLPRLPKRKRWHVAVNTSMPAPLDSYPPGQEVELDDQTAVIAGGRSVMILLGR